MSNNLQILNLYKDRQVIINQYSDGELTDKNGFFIDCIAVNENRVKFMKNNVIAFSIDLKQFPTFKTLDDFKNFYSFTNELEDHIDIYFP